MCTLSSLKLLLPTLTVRPMCAMNAAMGSMTPKDTYMQKPCTTRSVERAVDALPMEPVELVSPPSRGQRYHGEEGCNDQSRDGPAVLGVDASPEFDGLAMPVM